MSDVTPIVSWAGSFESLLRKYSPWSPVGREVISRLEDLILSEMALTSFRHFVQWEMPPYLWSRHNLVLAQALQAVSEGVIRRLIVMMPPRHGKTEQCSVKFPAYLLGQDPSTRVVLASYSSQLAVKNSRQVRDTVMASWRYKQVFPHVRLNPNKMSEREWETPEGGGCLAVGVGTGLTGRGSDVTIIDDPIKDAEEASSPTIRQNIYDWFATVVRTRLAPGAKIVVVYTPWHEQDMGQKIIQLAEEEGAEGWWVLRLAAIAEEDDPLGRDEGEALWPEMYPVADLETIRAYDPPYFASMYQCRPRAAGSKMFDKDWFVKVDGPSRDYSWCRSWDLAVTEQQGSDFTVGSLVGGAQVPIDTDMWNRLRQLGFPRPIQLCVADVRRWRQEFPQIRHKIYETAQSDGLEVPILLEKVRMDLGSLQLLRNDLREMGFTVVMIPPEGDKVARAGPYSVAVESGRVEYLAGPWNAAWLNEHDPFPQVDHDDQVDSISQAYNFLQAGGFRMEVV